MVDSNTAAAESGASGDQRPQAQSVAARLTAGIAKVTNVKPSAIPSIGKAISALVAAAKTAEAGPQAIIPGPGLPAEAGDAEQADPVSAQPTAQVNSAVSKTANAAGPQIILDAIATLTGQPAPAKKATVKPDKSPEDNPGLKKDAAEPDSGNDGPSVAAADPSTAPNTSAVAAAIDVAATPATDNGAVGAPNTGRSPVSIDAGTATGPSPVAIGLDGPNAEPATVVPPAAVDVSAQASDPAAPDVKSAASATGDAPSNADSDAKANSVGRPKRQATVNTQALAAAPAKAERAGALNLQAIKAGTLAAQADVSGDIDVAMAKSASDKPIADTLTVGASKPAVSPEADSAQPKSAAADRTTPDEAATKVDLSRPDQQPQADAAVRDAPVTAAKTEIVRHDQQPQPDALAASKPASDALPPLTIAQTNNPATPAALDKASMAAPAAAVPVSGLAVEITSKARDGKNSFDIRLDPPELGRIHVRLDVSRDGEITSHVIADRSDTLDLLRRDSGALERALQDAGLKTANNGLQYSLRDHGFGRNDQPSQPATTSHLVVSDEPTETMLPVYRVLAGARAGVDIRV